PSGRSKRARSRRRGHFGYPEACGTVSECVQVVAVDPDGGRWIVGVDRTRRAPFVLQVMGNGGYRDATQEDGPWHMRLNPGDDVLWQAAFILEEGFRARRIEYCRPELLPCCTRFWCAGAVR